ncbi:hypothetical protein [Noviherbaspirillum sedimenti]|uniref:hypothetical protein n=1 Tax=Noviherbaspirillum sedimenti TaxID=2320865 RepID=UPI0011C4A7CE|nr:hypothetical protein [Noviherbaspirillum sedimenti]
MNNNCGASSSSSSASFRTGCIPPSPARAYGREVFEIRKSFLRANLPYAEPIDGVTPQVPRMLQCMEGELARAELNKHIAASLEQHFDTVFTIPDGETSGLWQS